jgi:hypothetical protein
MSYRGTPTAVTTSTAISQEIERRSVDTVECTIPTGMTIEQWRRQRPSLRRPERRHKAQLLPSARRVVSLRPEPCDHIHESTSRYDHTRKLLTFLLVCPVCRTEKIVESQHYVPRFEPHPAPQPPDAGGATIHQLPVRRDERPLRRAA